MEIPDLQVLSRHHPPAAYLDKPVLSSRSANPKFVRLPRSLKLLAAGWLGAEVPSRGEVPGECIERLFDAYESHEVIGDSSMGPHTCEICVAEDGLRTDNVLRPEVKWGGRKLCLYGHGHHLVQLGEVVYICPVLILHYILDHGYKPPRKFLQAVDEGKFITTTRDIEPRNRFAKWLIRNLKVGPNGGSAS